MITSDMKVRLAVAGVVLGSFFLWAWRFGPGPFTLYSP
jgi:hypothetical protein